MGLSKLSEKCKKCKHKDDCDEKRMEACSYIVPSIPRLPKFATGGLVGHRIPFGGSDKEIIGSVSFGSESCKVLSDVIAKNIKRCAFKGVMH